MWKRKKIDKQRQGVGLKSLFNRAKLVGAELALQSEIGKGTRVTIKIPATAI